MESEKRSIPPKPGGGATDGRLKAEAPLKSSNYSLLKHKSWSPDILREEDWSRRKRHQQKLRGGSRSVTDDDLKELKACFDLGFRFDSPESDPKLCNTFPALEMFNTINKQYSRSLSRSNSSSSSTTLTTTDCASPTSSSSTDAVEPSYKTIFDSGDDNPKKVKAKLRQWAQLVACMVRQSSRN